MNECFVTSPVLSAVTGVRHAFSTRVGGVSRGAFASLNLSYGPDAPEHVATNRARLAEAAGLHGRWVEVQQVHGDRVVDAVDVEPDTEADAIVVREPGVFAAVRTADCVPVLAIAVDAQQRPVAAAAIHAGWRGAVTGVISRTIERLTALGHEPPTLRVATGPAISIRHFEVGPEVVEAASAALGGRTPPLRVGPNGRAYLDLPALVRLQLEAAGIEAEHLGASPACTYADADRFFSYRRQRGRCGHHLSLVGFVP
jgi:hypothetical protein